jgi:hypothetical protein
LLVVRKVRVDSHVRPFFFARNEISTLALRRNGLESRAMASTGSTIYKTVRWIVVVALLIVVFMMLKRPAPAAPPLTAATVAEKSTEFNTKLQSLQSAQEQGGGGEATFTSEEVNSFITDSSIRAAQQAAAPPSVAPSDTSDTTADAGPPLTDEEIRQAQEKTQVAFEGDEVVAQTMVERYGRDIYVTVRGKLGAQNGYLEFKPTAFKIGEVSVPVSLVNDRLQEKLAEPETHEKLKLPAFIADLYVQNGQLTIKQK